MGWLYMQSLGPHKTPKEHLNNNSLRRRRLSGPSGPRWWQ